MASSSHGAEAYYTGVDFAPTSCREKREMAEKNRRKERRIPDQRLKRSEKGKRSNSRSMKKEDRNSSKPDCHSESFLTGNIPPHINKEEKTETPSFRSKKHYPRENPIGP